MDGWDSQKALDRYILDYMVKNNMRKTAEIFAREANVAPDDFVVDSPDGFLSEWWSIFWDQFSYRLQNQPENGGEPAEAAACVARNSGPIPPRPEMNPQAFGSMLQGLFSTMPNPEMNQQTSAMQPPTSNPALNEQTMGVTQPPSSIPNPATNQRMFADIPDVLQEEPISILLAKMYEQECLRHPARDLANNVQQLDAAKMNPMLASTSKSR